MTIGGLGNGSKPVILFVHKQESKIKNNLRYVQLMQI